MQIQGFASFVYSEFIAARKTKCFFVLNFNIFTENWIKISPLINHQQQSRKRIMKIQRWEGIVQFKFT